MSSYNQAYPMTVLSHGGTQITNLNTSNNTTKTKKQYFWDNMDEEQAYCCSFSIFAMLFIGILLVCILVPLSFQYVRYNEYAFVRNKYGTVDTENVLTQGRYFRTLNYDVVKFSSTYTATQFTDDRGTSLSVFTDDGFQLDVNIVFFYRLQTSTLASIYGNFTTNYAQSIIGQATTRIKNTAVQLHLPLSSYITNRTDIQFKLATAVKNDLETNFGVEVPIKYFSLMHINIPQALIDQNLRTVVQIQDNIIQQNRQNIVQVTAETETLVSRILASTNFVIVSSQIESNAIVSNSQSTATKILLSARSIGINQTFATLGFTNKADQERIIRLWSIMDAQNPKLIYGLQGQTLVNV